jgi:hypothetical protein
MIEALFADMGNLLWSVALLLVAYAGGRRCARLLVAQFAGPWDAMVFSTALGLGMQAYVTLGIGLVGGLYPIVGYALFALMLFWGRREALQAAGQVLSLRTRLATWRPRTRVELAIVIALAWSILISLAGALAPPSHADTLHYVMAAPKAYVQQHHISFVPAFTWAAPFTVEMLYSLAMLLHSDVVGALLSFSMSLLLAAALAAFVTEHLRMDRRWALGAALLLYVVPRVLEAANNSKDHMGLTLFAFLAVYAVINWLRSQDRGWLWLSGILAGLAASSKIHGLFVVAGLVFALVVDLIRSERANWRKALVAVVLFGMVATLVGSPWYVRNAVATGNPVWPMFNRLFGGGYTTAALEELVHSGSYFDSNPVGLLLELLRSAWDITVNVFPDDRSVLSPVFLALVPGLVLFRRGLTRSQLRIAVLLGIFVLIYYLLWFVTRRNIAHLIVVLPPLTVLVLLVVAQMEQCGAFLRWTGRLALLCSVAIGLLAGTLYNAQFARVVLGLESRDSFLRDNTWYYDDLQWANRNLPRDAYVLLFPRHGYYLDRPYIVGSTIEQALIDYSAIHTPRELWQQWHGLGITHVIVDGHWYGVVSRAYFNSLANKFGALPDPVGSLAAVGGLVQVHRSESTITTSRVLGATRASWVEIYALASAPPVDSQ